MSHLTVMRARAAGARNQAPETRIGTDGKSRSASLKDALDMRELWA
jgi:hypothetical protein